MLPGRDGKEAKSRLPEMHRKGRFQRSHLLSTSLTTYNVLAYLKPLRKYGKSCCEVYFWRRNTPAKLEFSYLTLKDTAYSIKVPSQVGKSLSREKEGDAREMRPAHSQAGSWDLVGPQGDSFQFWPLNMEINPFRRGNCLSVSESQHLLFPVYYQLSTVYLSGPVNKLGQKSKKHNWNKL